MYNDLLRLQVPPVKSRFPPRRLDEHVSAESVVDGVDVADLPERHVDRHFHLRVTRIAGTPFGLLGLTITQVKAQ